MKGISLFILIVVALLFNSCMDMAGINGENEEVPAFSIIQGYVTDMEGMPLERIRITIKAAEGSETLTYYTSSEGRFRCELPYGADEHDTVLDIMIEDIDGEENGGLYESKTDRITIFKEDQNSGPILLDLPIYRLSRATASANNPQS